MTFDSFKKSNSVLMLVRERLTNEADICGKLSFFSFDLVCRGVVIFPIVSTGSVFPLYMQLMEPSLTRTRLGARLVTPHEYDK